MSTLYGDNIFGINEAVTKIKYGFSTGIKVKGKSIGIYSHKDRPTKEEVEAILPTLKKSAKLINDGWSDVVEAASKKYSDRYNVSEDQAKKILIIHQYL